MHSYNRMRILIIDDDEEEVALIKARMRDLEPTHTLCWAPSLKRADAALQKCRFDAVVCDLQLLVLDQFRTLEKWLCSYPDLPTLALSSLDDLQVARTAIDCGVQEVVSRESINSGELQRAILHAALRQKATSQLQTRADQVQAECEQLSQQNESLCEQNQQLNDQHRTAQEFLLHLSHKLRTPLTVITDFVLLLAESMIGEITPKQKELLSRMNVRAEDMRLLADDLLDACRVQTQDTVVTRRKTTLRELTELAVPWVAQRAEIRGVDFHCDLPAHAEPLFCDREQIHRMIIGLSAIAINEVGRGGKVRIEVRQQRSEGHIGFRITGTPESPTSRRFNAIKEQSHFREQGEPTITTGAKRSLHLARTFCEQNLSLLQQSTADAQQISFAFELPFLRAEEVMARWAKGLTPSRLSVQMLRVEIPQDCRHQDRVTFESFLDRLVHPSDLIFPNGNNCWVINRIMPRDAVTSWLIGSRVTWRNENAMCASPQLPPFEVEHVASWRLDGGEELARMSVHHLLPFHQHGSDASIRAPFHGSLRNVDEFKTNSHRR